MHRVLGDNLFPGADVFHKWDWVLEGFKVKEEQIIDVIVHVIL